MNFIIVINKFNGGLSGFGNFIENSTEMVNSINAVISEVNETETISYIHKTKLIIDMICSENIVNCSKYML